VKMATENFLPHATKLTLLIKYKSLMVWVLNKVVKCQLLKHEG